MLQDDAEQSAIARRAIEELTEREPGFVTVLVLCEFAWVLSRTYGQSREQVAAALGGLLAVPAVEVEQADLVHRALEQFLGTSADFADCCIGELGMSAGCGDTVTFDVKAAKLPGMRLLR